MVICHLKQPARLQAKQGLKEFRFEKKNCQIYRQLDHLHGLSGLKNVLFTQIKTRLQTMTKPQHAIEKILARAAGKPFGFRG
jgi:hypothetical protein